MRLTAKEKRAISQLQMLAAGWPKTLTLFSWSGSLHVIKPGPRRTMGQALVAAISIPSDGGDPNMTDPSAP